MDFSSRNNTTSRLRVRNCRALTLPRLTYITMGYFYALAFTENQPSQGCTLTTFYQNLALMSYKIGLIRSLLSREIKNNGTRALVST